jgi:hypothetical protein
LRQMQRRDPRAAGHFLTTPDGRPFQLLLNRRGASAQPPPMLDRGPCTRPNFLYIQRRPSWRRQTLRFAELSRWRFQSDQSVCGDSNLGTRCVAALFNPVELQQTVEHSIADRYGQSVPQFPNARPQVVQDLTLSTIRCIRFHWVVVQLFTTFRLSGRIGRM